MNIKSKTQLTFEVILLMLTWFALVLQFIIKKDSITSFFSYFTILSNLLIAVSLTAEIFLPRTKMGNWFAFFNTKSAIAIYIIIVGVVYNLVLRGIWEPKGWQLVADNLLHVIVPISYFIYWIFFTPKGILLWKNAVLWSYFPLAYLIYSLIRGYYVGWYPYPFLNVAQFGLQQVLINSVFVLIAFIVFSTAMIGFNKMMATKK